MKPQNLHAHEDRLLDFAYGELPAHEARAVESHLQGCTRCTEALDGIRGVRTTMAQLPMEPAPDAGLESLLAYAQQAARNAAAGPALKPTWWRRWLVPAMGVAAVSIFGIITVQVNKSVDLSAEQAVTASRMNKDEAAPAASAPPAPEPPPAYAEPAAATPPARLAEAAQAPSEPVAKLDTSTVEKFKDAPRKKALKPSSYDADSNWSNAGAGAGRVLEEKAATEEYKQEHTYDRRDAMTQATAFNKSKPILVGKTAPSTPAPSAAPVMNAPPPPPADAQPGAVAPAGEYAAGADMDDGAMAAAPQVQQQGPVSASLRVGDAKRGAAKAADKEQEEDSLDVVLGGRASEAKREQRTRAPEMADYVPKAPSAAGTSAPAPVQAQAPAPASAARAENQAASPDELSKLAMAAMRQRDRVREAQYLRQALEAGATGKERLGLLNRLCDAEFSIGRRQAAIEACTLVLEEDPRSSAAQVARSRLSRESPAQAKPDSRLSAPKSAAPAKAADMESAPTQAY
jgi:hypothetical protein